MTMRDRSLTYVKSFKKYMENQWFERV